MTQYRKVILDASAIIALMNDEKGAEVVTELLGSVVMSSVNVYEVIKFLIDRRGYTNLEAQSIVDQLVERVMSFDKAQAEAAAAFYPSTKHLGLSLADRACLALSKITGYPIYTADKIWKKAEIDDIAIKLIR